MSMNRATFLKVMIGLPFVEKATQLVNMIEKPKTKIRSAISERKHDSIRFIRDMKHFSERAI